jgi:hypothetical protein
VSKLTFTPHALHQFRARWSSTSTHKDAALVAHIYRAIKQAEDAGDVFESPPTTFYPFTFQGEDGYIAVRGGEIKTVLPTKYCPEVEEVRNGKSTSSK